MPRSGLPLLGLDDELVRDVAQGSDAALAELYDRHAASVYRVAVSVARDRSVAEEVVQETFLALWNRADIYDAGRGSLVSWLSTIARNRALDRVRAVARRPPAAPLSRLSADQPDPAATIDWLVASGHLLGGGAPDLEPEDVVAAREANSVLANALTGLTAVERLPIVLAYRDGLTQFEIAARLGWPLGTVKTRSRRALRRLRDALTEMVDEETPRSPADVPREPMLVRTAAPQPCALPC